MSSTSIDRPLAPSFLPGPPPSHLVFPPHGQVSPSLLSANTCPSPVTAKGHLQQDPKNVRSTRTTSPPTPISNPPVMTTPPLPLQEPGVRTQMVYLQTVKFTGKVSTDQTGSFPVTSSCGSKYLMVLYDHDSNAILAEPLTSRSERELIQYTRVLHYYLSARGLTPQYRRLDNECPGGLDLQLVPPYLHCTSAVESAIQIYKDNLVAGLSICNPIFPLYLLD